MGEGPTDWTSGERVFAPPSGTLDVDWLVPAVLEAVPGVTPDEARAALAAAWHRCTTGERIYAGDLLKTSDARPEACRDRLREAATRVVAEALEAFRA